MNDAEPKHALPGQAPEPVLESHADPFPGLGGGTSTDTRPVGTREEIFAAAALFEGGHVTEKKAKPIRSLVIVLVVIAALIAAVAAGGTWAYKYYESRQGPEIVDFAETSGEDVLFQVSSGDTATRIGENLFEQEIVGSVAAFVQAATVEPRATQIQVGFYQLKSHMKAADALKVLIDPANLVMSKLVIPEGSRLSSIKATILSSTDIAEADLDAALADPVALGVPAEAADNIEGYLYPATYDVHPGETATELLTNMVAAGAQVRQTLGLPDAAAVLGLTEHEVVTLASIVQAEAGVESDMPKIARVFFNRLDNGGLLESDATRAYGAGAENELWASDETVASDSPYNTYKYSGLPPGPIDSPGEAALDAVLHPAEGDWLFFVLVDIETGETHFSTTLGEHEQWVEKSKENTAAYCVKYPDAKVCP